MRVCSCVLAETEACKHCNNNYERSDFQGVLKKNSKRSLKRNRRIKKRDA